MHDASPFVTNTATSMHLGHTKSVIERRPCVHDALPYEVEDGCLISGLGHDQTTTILYQSNFPLTYAGHP